MQNLDLAKQKLQKKAQAFTKKQKDFEKTETKLTTLIKKRKNLVDRQNKELSAYEKEIIAFARQAKTMESLLSKLSVHKPQLSKKAHYSESFPKRGNKQLPVTGIIKTAFGEIDSIGAKSAGIKLAVKNGGRAIAPMGGIIKYVGAFKNYKNMIIIEHKDNYHSIIAGLDQIDVRIGQSVLSGEPIGSIRRRNVDSQAASAILYYELRHKGRPVSPT